MKLVRKRKLWTLVGFGVVLIAIFVLVASLSPIDFEEGHLLIFGESGPSPSAGSGVRTPNPNDELGDFWGGALTIIFWILLPISVLYLIISKQARKRVIRDLLIISGFLLMLYFLINIFTGDGKRQAQSNVPAPGESDPPDTLLVPNDFLIDPPGWVTWLATFLLIALVILLIAVIWFKMRPTAVKEKTNRLEQLVDEAQVTLHHLRSGANLKDTVIRCYHDMCSILAEHQGVRRRRAMTPREFQDHLGRIGFSNEHTARLTKLFEAVRYGGQASNLSAAHEAELCLESIVESYGRSS